MPRGAARVRRIKSAAYSALAVAAAALALAPLFFIIGSTLYNGLTAIAAFGPPFFWSLPPAGNELRGGVGPQLLGTLLMAALGAALGSALGIPLGVYIGERRHEGLASTARVGVQVLVEFPTLVVGLFVFSIAGKFSGYAGAAALGIVMVPYVALLTGSALSNVKQPLREAAYALTGSEAKAVWVLVRAVARAIVTAVLIGTAKIAGETAPLLFTAFGNDFYTGRLCIAGACAPFVDLGQPAPAVSLLVYHYAQSSFPAQVAAAWGAAAVLLAAVLALFILSRLLGRGWT